jgi:alkylation response protein AidB-like acyl-CoA dehydrogenase
VTIGLTEEQTILRDTLASYLRDQYDFEKRRAAVLGAGWRPDSWRAFADELGILGAGFPEELGGLGGGAVETMIVMEEFGKALVLEPYLGTVVIGGGFLRHSDHPAAAQLIGDIVAGKNIFAFAHTEPAGRYNLAAVSTAAKRAGTGWRLNGRKAVVMGAPIASHLVVTARTAGDTRDARGLSVFLVERTARGIGSRDYRTIDGQCASDLVFDNVSLGAESLLGTADEGLPLIERVVDEAIAALCAEACGVLRILYEGTLDYTRQRKQYGVPIGSFQVLQHRMVDMYIQLEQAVAMTSLATGTLTDPAGRSKAVAAAKVQIGKACRFVGQNAIQLHGGIGTTDELAIGHYFKRATMIEGAFGSTDHHLARYEALSLGEVGQESRQ